MIGQTLGSYSIQRELGRGGMGAVFVGVHGLLGRTAAVKVLLPELSRNQEIVQRFFNEARAATAIRHPGIVEIYDFGFAADGSAFIVMEFLDGESLSARLRRHGRIAPGLALGVARQTALALAAAHRIGIVHRDLKPDNVFLVPDVETSIGERVKLLDFGIAKLAGDAGAGAGGARTSTGAIMGTPYYMSPEQCKGAGHVDHRSDLYSLGCMLYEMSTGRVPFTGEGAGEIIAAHIHVPVTPPRQLAPDLPPDVERLILRLMAKRADERPASADALAQEIGALLASSASASVPVIAAPPQAPTVHAPAPVPAPTPVQAPPTVHASTPAQAHAPVAPASTTIGQASGEPIPTAAPKKRTGLVLGIGAAVAVAAVIAIVVASGGGGSGAAKSGGATDAGASAAVTIDAAPRATAADAAAADPVMAALAEARSAIELERWPDVVVSCRAVLDARPDEQECRALIELAKKEQANQLTYDDFHDAVAKKDYAAVVKTFGAIGGDSLYKEKARPAHDQVRDEYVASVTAKAEAYAKKGKCKELASLAKSAGKIWQEAADAAEDVQCKEGRATAGKGEKPDKSDDPYTSSDDGSGKTADDLIKDSNAAARAGQYAKALRLAEQALKQDPGNMQALTGAALASCNLHDAAKAKKYINKLSDQRQGMARQLCLRNNVAID